MALLEKLALRKDAQMEELKPLIPYVDDTAIIIAKYLTSKNLPSSPVNKPVQDSKKESIEKKSMDLTKFAHLKVATFKSLLASKLLGALKIAKKPISMESSAGVNVIKKLQKLYPKSTGSFIRTKLREA
jgi:hypothetical protein